MRYRAWSVFLDEIYKFIPLFLSTSKEKEINKNIIIESSHNERKLNKAA